MANKKAVKVEKDAVNEVKQPTKPDIASLAVETKVKPLAGTKVSKLKGDGVYLRNSLTNKIIAGPISMHLASIQQRDFAHIEIVDKDGKQD